MAFLQDGGPGNPTANLPAKMKVAIWICGSNLDSNVPALCVIATAISTASLLSKSFNGNQILTFLV